MTAIQSQPLVVQYTADETSLEKSSLNVFAIKDDGVTKEQILTDADFIAPIGSIFPWLKTYTNTPALPSGWVECDGATLSDADSVYDGQTIPNLNANKFFRGASASGGTGGSETHTHSLNTIANSMHGGNDEHMLQNTTGSVSTLPTYYEVVWIMRVK